MDEKKIRNEEIQNEQEQGLTDAQLEDVIGGFSLSSLSSLVPNFLTKKSIKVNGEELDEEELVPGLLIKKSTRVRRKRQTRVGNSESKDDLSEFI